MSTLLDNYIKTENFSWVRKEIYQKYNFLRRDVGVPTKEITRETKDGFIEKISIVDDIYYEYLKEINKDPEQKRMEKVLERVGI